MANKKIIYQFRLELLEITPVIWRRIQVPAEYSFWDLHVAIQDAMGWLDCHLHEYRIKLPRSRSVLRIGLPDEALSNDVLPEWKVPIVDYFSEPGCAAEYEYDFGDGWNHRVLLEGILLREPSIKYPACIAGERACPPEDCGGIPGYEYLLEVLAGPDTDEYQDMVNWLRGHHKNYFPYLPEHFVPSDVKFSSPRRRWNSAFG